MEDVEQGGNPNLLSTSFYSCGGFQSFEYSTSCFPFLLVDFWTFSWMVQVIGGRQGKDNPILFSGVQQIAAWNYSHRTITNETVLVKICNPSYVIWSSS